MSNAPFPWQNSSWTQLNSLRQRLPHALLLHGPKGIGEHQLAERFAQSLLCEAVDSNGHPCDSCASCGWFVQGSHPDYRRIRPEALSEEDASSDETATEEGETKKSAKASKTPSKEIKIDQIRSLADFVNVSTHRSGLRVIVLYPAQSLNAAASNALLKTLEEPPPGTIFLLVTSQIDRLLPTIISRCRKIALTLPASEQALQWLKTQGISDAESLLAEQGGAPLAAQSAGTEESGARELLQHLVKPELENMLKAAEQLQKQSLSELVTTLQRWLYDLFSLRYSGTIRYYPKYRNELDKLARRANAKRLLEVMKLLNQRRAVVDHPLSARLVIEDMLIDYSSVFK